ncbi:MAG: bile acid:sodium symporter family protein [Gammaproteobacteria bacterium]|nr:bile acid:sodium symporter family protein [Gammaproteobacteria bacterium]MBT8150621.1 bile acid:sodium symporter family protein [Gammaproteobacteria bacterium]NND38827.1 bile acid:sodium symporter family protein [Pseudomonadales bacterium]NNM10898.1 bile acid:sodium symporter family protein [Pseudomonadales bacterium]RZV51807.1 MAG: bile acid:sodium symporter family protein [Pseudomonadales bacterium]
MGELYLRFEYHLAFVQLVLAMAGMGATLRLSDFAAVAAAPAAFLLGFAMQLLMVPGVAALAMFVFSLDPGVAVGLAIIAAVPGGTTSNIYTFFARGNIALSIAITAVTSLVCLASVPIILDFLISDYVPSDFAMPRARIAMEVLVTLLIPLAAGMLLLHSLPSFADLFSRWAIRISLAIIVLIALGAAMSGRLDWQTFGLQNLAIVAGFVVVLLLLGFLLPGILGFSNPDVIAINMEVVVRNVNLGLLIKASLFPATAMALQGIAGNALFTILMYASMMIPLALVLIVYGRRKSAST